jgi:hypothetical protein
MSVLAADRRKSDFQLVFCGKCAAIGYAPSVTNIKPLRELRDRKRLLLPQDSYPATPIKRQCALSAKRDTIGFGFHVTGASCRK